MEANETIDWEKLFRDLLAQSEKTCRAQIEYFAARKRHQEGKRELAKAKAEETKLHAFIKKGKDTLKDIDNKLQLTMF